MRYQRLYSGDMKIETSAGEESVYFKTEIDWSGVLFMARCAALKSQRSAVAGPIRVSIIKRSKVRE